MSPSDSTLIVSILLVLIGSSLAISGFFLLDFTVLLTGAFLDACGVVLITYWYNNKENTEIREKAKKEMENSRKNKEGLEL